MENQEILQRIEKFTGKFERQAVEAAVASPEEVIPGLLHILEEIADLDRACERDFNGDYMDHLYAMFLLAQFRETRAYPLVLRIAQHPSDLLESLFGDFITENLDSVLASVCGGDIVGIQALIENKNVDEWVRGAALGALVDLVAAGVKSREEMIGYFAELFHGKLKDKNEIVWSNLVVYSTDLYATELLGDIEWAYKKGLVDTSIIGLEDVKRDFSKGLDWALTQLATNPHRKLVDDTVKEMGWWACFEENKKRQPPRETPFLKTVNGPLSGLSASLQSSSPVTGQPAPYKMGRNEPCYCGSGKKYKKCCGQ